ncbi:glutaredoxin 3 [Paracoccus nototheniae]|uniref:Glutaredoxin n=1 Tax=Paracoccus nototheniae TaxID=2489002 RepID=A0ABW4DSK5_9RHOB|nr:glutaredoxin 3 [Paracoccus nototheniae]
MSIQIYTTRTCPFCIRAKQLLDQKGARYTETDVGADPALRDAMTKRAGKRSVPQIFVGQTHVGGCDDLYALDRAGKLDALLKDAA